MGLWSRLRNTWRGTRHAAEIRAELDFHREMLAAAGDDPRRSRLRLGNVAQVAEATRAVSVAEWLESALRDARYGLRQLRRTPVLTGAVLLSLTIGIGANTAMFSLVDAALLKPLPVADPGRLRIVEWTSADFPARASNHNGEFRPVAGGLRQGSSVPAHVYRRLAREQTAFAVLIGMAAYPDAVSVAIGAAPSEQVSVQYVSANYFQGLGVAPVLGRPFRDEEDQVGAEPVVAVSHRFWQRHLQAGGDPLGTVLHINTVPTRIVGVLPHGFFGFRAGQWPDVYAPLAAKVAFQPGPGPSRGEDPNNWWVRQVGRLNAGAGDDARARKEIAHQFRLAAAAQGATGDYAGAPELVTAPGWRGLDALSTRDGDALWTLMLLVGILLLIVCVNVANLLLSRSIGRQRESGIRLALGAAPRRLVRQHLIESGLLAAAGGLAGLAFGYVLAQAIHAQFQLGRDASAAFDLAVNPRTMIYTASLAVATALLFGMAPALSASRTSLNEALGAQSRAVVGGRLRAARVLVVTQIALCLAALIAAGLLVRSLANLKALDIGFAREHLAYATMTPSRARYAPEQIASYVERVRGALAGLPGVTGATPVQTRLLSGGGNHGSVNIPGRPFQPGVGAHLNGVREDYFETMGIPIIAGRTLRAGDATAKPEPVVVDDLFVRQFLADGQALGRRFGLGPQGGQQFEVVGIARNTRYFSLRGEAVPNLYQPYRPGGTVHFAVRSAIDPAYLAEPVRAAVSAVDHAVPLTEYHTQTALIDRLLRTERLLGLVSAAFGALAVTLAAIGLGGLLFYNVSRRTNEIGVRIALGAGGGDVTRMVMRDAMATILGGTFVGLPCAYGVARTVETLLFQVGPLDPWSALFAVATLLTVAAAAAWVPARRAARVDPLVALRDG